ncbi:AcrB/AcrD/AcrF family protein [Oceanidesulfovibrio indonesiensis]|uniref:AcrB/AcrD/AcrF family protein n=1 Tax=Oceanidesulfovibrio indonesiensis TaxID=54767 RepID=A0A7M3MIP8_9BACT|nr:efflux RND transporter permease subunit [Oceanidesulfovibrio indonesiensis]TVM19683.1 AcrB/AcrD/AcrF family protein [Oceanidesulfovibrio indonesiensis]
MDIVRFSIKNPVTVLVGVILVLLFGIIGLYSLPYQLSPTVTEPQISVTTTWPGATPYDIEREIIEEQEKVLKGIPKLVSMESSSFNSQGEITLKFQIGTDVDSALLRVSNKLNEVPQYPENVDRPIINASGADTSPIIWLVLKTTEDNPRSIDEYKTFFEDEVRQYLERVPGVADLFVFGGTESEMHIVVDPERLAAHKLTMDDFVNIIAQENTNVSAGNMQVSRREYRIRTLGEYQSPEEIEEVVLTSTGQRRIKVKDVAKVQFDYETNDVAMLHNGEKGIVCGIKPEPDANVLEVTDAMEQVIIGLNEGLLAENGLYYDWTYDQRPYINGAIQLVQQNILLGGTLAVIVLFIFLRRVSSTVIVTMAIPISIVGTFMFMSFLGRNLNVISLAGISFSVGMLVDAAIVVLENIDRHRSMGKGSLAAAYDGAKEVWGAVLASTLTTVAVFLPVVFMEEEAGQLFKDIAIAITSAILLSLFVSVSVIPMLSNQFFKYSDRRKLAKGKKLHQKREATGPAARLGGVFAGGMMRLVQFALKNWATRLATIGAVLGFAVLVVTILWPKMEYLPTGNRNLLINILIPPPGLSYEERMEIGEYIYSELEPFMGKDYVGDIPGIANTFYVGAPQIMLFGVISTQEQEAAKLINPLMGIIHSIPGMYGVSLQAGIFEDRIGGGRSIDVDLTGPEIEGLIAAGGAMYGAISQAVPGSRIRPVPSLELLFPEIKIIPDRERLRAAGLTTSALGVAMDIIMDGRKVSEFKEEGSKKIDLVVRAGRDDIKTPEQLYEALVVTPEGRSLPVSSLAALERTTGITEIRHLERHRTVTLQVTPPETISLQEAMETIENGVVPNMREQGLFEGVNFSMSGAADKLVETRKAMEGNFLLAVFITYLLMAALFGNFVYPLIVLFTVPLAAVGGVLGLSLQSIFIALQNLDVLTMLGFVILIGVVVNNAILVVHQSLNNIRYAGMEHKEAVLEAVRTRIRPIYMSATTSVFGMLPLAVMPGPGSELYRGLGSVVLGGLALSTVFTVFLVPSLLMFCIRMEKVGSGKSNGVDYSETEAAS